MVVYSSLPSIGFHCEPFVGETGSGWSWTLVSRLSDLLQEAQDRYGPRDHDWTILGIEFGGDRPNVWYPGDSKYVSIKLSDNARLDPARAIFQLAHEVIHLLAPTGGKMAPAMEEGLATIYSEEIAARFSAAYWYSEPEYIHCREITKQFLSFHPDGVRKTREVEKSFRLITPNLIRSMFPDVPEELAVALCEPFFEVEKRLSRI